MKLLASLDGLIIIAIGLIYGILALQIEHSTVVENRVGAEIFPIIVSVLIILSGAIMILRGENSDHKTIWPSAKVWGQIGLLVIVFLIYSIFFDTIGFVISNAVLCTYIGVLIGGKVWKSAVAGLVISITILALFSWTLEINLPSGVLGFLDDIIDPLEP